MIATSKYNSANTQIKLNDLLSNTGYSMNCEYGEYFSGDLITDIKKNSNFEFTTTFYEPSLKEIYLHQRRFIFNRPLIYKIETEEDYFVMESDELDVVGTGKTPQEAFISFAEEFQFIFDRYSKISDSKISKRLRKIKENLNSLVFEVD